MHARFADAGRLGRETEALGLALGAAESVAVFAGQAAVLATIAGHQAELPPIVAQAIGAGPVKLTYHLAHAIASGPEQVASDLLGEAAADGFRNVPPDLMWLTSMLGYAILAIERVGSGVSWHAGTCPAVALCVRSGCQPDVDDRVHERAGDSSEIAGQ